MKQNQKFDPLNPEGKKKLIVKEKIQEKIQEKKKTKVIPQDFEDLVDDESFKPIVMIKANIKDCTSDEADHLVKLVVEGLKKFNDIHEFETKFSVMVSPFDD